MSRFKKNTAGLFICFAAFLFLLVTIIGADSIDLSTSIQDFIVTDNYCENGSSTVGNPDERRGKSHISKPLAESGTSTAGNPPKRDKGTTMPPKGSVV